MNYEGYVYKCTKTTRDGKRYYVCATPNVYCKGTAIKLGDGIIVSKKPHSHGPNDDNFQSNEVKKQFRTILVNRAKTETNPLKIIYDEESIRNPRAAMLYTWPTAESSMRQARRETVPHLPTTLRELGEYLDLNSNRYQCGNEQFYQEWIADNDGKYSLMFACQDLISSKVHQGSTEMHADGTLKVVPSTPYCRQLFIIQNHSIPVCFVLMESKSENAYKNVLERFKVKFPNIRPTYIMIDFETALHNAFEQVYPEAHISSCWFHYVVYRKISKKMGYTNYLQQNMAAKICVRMVTVLALLLPHQIEEGFQNVKTYAQANGVLLPRFFTYFSSFWITTKGPECFSVHGQPCRTNNNVESFHSSLKQTFQVVHPNLWKMLEHLNNISKKQHIIVSQLARGQPTTRNLKIKYILNSVRIKNASDELNIGLINIKEFLIKCSYCTERYFARELSWGDEPEDSDDEMHMPINIDIPIDPPIQIAPIAVPEIQDEPDVIIVEDFGDDSEYVIPEDLEMGIWQNMQNNYDEPEIPFVQVPQNINELHPQIDEENICIVCKVATRTHALVPCGHRILCVNCLDQLEAQRCPLCNMHYNASLRIW